MMSEVGVHAARGLIMVMFGEGGLGTGKAYLVRNVERSFIVVG